MKRLAAVSASPRSGATDAADAFLLVVRHPSAEPGTNSPEATPLQRYRFAPKASRRPSQSFTTNSRECHGVLPSPRVNSTPWPAYSA